MARVSKLKGQPSATYQGAQSRSSLRSSLDVPNRRMLRILRPACGRPLALRYAAVIASYLQCAFAQLETDHSSLGD
jgi:hypothetical protein